MTISEMHIAIDQKIQKINAFVMDDIRPEEKDLFINDMTERFIKQRFYALSNSKQRGFEESQKRVMDLQTLIDSSRLLPDDPLGLDHAIYPFPADKDVMFLVSVDASLFEVNRDIVKTDQFYLRYRGTKDPASAALSDLVTGDFILVGTAGTFANFLDSNGTPIAAGINDILYRFSTYWVRVKENMYNTTKSNVPVRILEHEYLRKLMDNPFAASSTSSPVCVVRNNSLIGYFGKRFLLKELNIVFIRKPEPVNLSSSSDCELPAHTHSEIVDMTVKHILEITESGRYQANSIENNETE